MSRRELVLPLAVRPVSRLLTYVRTNRTEVCDYPRVTRQLRYIPHNFPPSYVPESRDYLLSCRLVPVVDTANSVVVVLVVWPHGGDYACTATALSLCLRAGSAVDPRLFPALT